ncbi:head-tail connector protein [Niallia sp. Man26]|uniref:head-tail connector protein n=1 Tax=Niallia sp. Man26 TaxID=2912824 RepID=UPI001EDC7FBB|nr:head-tail connector protein [Niallia sp. Man26]UPO88333.1 head-tail connector protein [Niallia sp. Man26]
MLEEVKQALRVSHNALDSDIEDIIAAARLDLKLSGISALKADAETEVDALIKRAIIVYSKANFMADVLIAEKYQQSYNSLKSHLALSNEYKAVPTV